MHIYLIIAGAAVALCILTPVVLKTVSILVTLTPFIIGTCLLGAGYFIYKFISRYTTKATA